MRREREKCMLGENEIRNTWDTLQHAYTDKHEEDENDATKTRCLRVTGISKVWFNNSTECEMKGGVGVF